MILLHSDWAYLEQEFGCSIRERFLMAIRSLDNPKAATPFLAEVNGRRFGLFLHVEKGNVEAANLPADITPVYYRPYFTFEPSERPPQIKLTLADAIEAIAEGERSITIDRQAPMAVAAELSTRFRVEIEGAPEIGVVTLRKAVCNATLERLGRGRAAAGNVARRLLEHSPVRNDLLPYLEEHADRRFAALDQLIEVAGFAGVVVSSTLNVQEIGGVPVAGKQRPLGVIYAPGDGHAWIIEHGRASGGRTFSNPEAALRDVIPRGRIGVEMEDVSLGMADALGLDRRDYSAADPLIRQWRDENTLPDLAYYIIASRTTRHAIEAALDFAASALRSDIVTEMDAYAVYLRSMREFVAANMQGARVQRTLTNFHTGARTIFPANAAPFPLRPGAHTLKIDAGCLLFDGEGVLLGCSDIARTLPLTDSAADLYHLFQRAVRQSLIPGAAAGRSGDAIHSGGVAAIWQHSREFAANPLFVDLKSPRQDYARDVGHLLGKNNLAHLRFVSGEHRQLREGMIACCEYQWPLKNNAIAYEDTCVVSRDRGLNITSDEE
jgi:Xaa-Pro aminopeptidase